MAELGTEIARRRNIAMTVRAEPDRRKALADADFVVSAFSVGGFDSMRHDLEIPERYGVVQPIGDSVGPGGVTRALRSIPVLLDIARDVEDVAPGAFLLNVTNPLTALCRSVTRETGCRTIGLCNEWVSTTFALSLLFDSGMHEIDAVLGGVNHFPLATSMTVAARMRSRGSRALLDDVGRRAGHRPLDGPARPHRVGSGPARPGRKADVLANNAVRMELFRRFGVFACSGDHHATEFVPGFVHAAHRLRYRRGRCTCTGWPNTWPTPKPTSRTTSRSATRTTCRGGRPANWSRRSSMRSSRGRRGASR